MIQGIISSMQEFQNYTYQDKEYKVIITRKRMRSIRYRLVGDTFKISAPFLASKASIQNGLVKYAPMLIERQKPASIGSDFIYIYGIKLPIINGNKIDLGSDKYLNFVTESDIDKVMKKNFLSYVSRRVRYFENLMQLKPHNVRVRDMSTRYGSNSKRTNTVCFTLKLYHYSPDIIDAIVVHELAHSIHFDHSKAFYDVVYKYCPNYKNLHRKLKKGVYQ